MSGQIDLASYKPTRSDLRGVEGDTPKFLRRKDPKRGKVQRLPNALDVHNDALRRSVVVE